MDSAEAIDAGIFRQAELIAAGEISSRELTEACLERIERLEPKINAFRIVLSERAREEADAADAKRAAGETAPLLGVPIAVKDNVDVAGELTDPRHERVHRDRPRGLRARPPAARRGRGDDRQDEPPRAGDHRLHRDRGLGDHPQPVGPRPHDRRLVRGIGSGRGGGDGRRGLGLRRRRLDPHPGGELRRVRAQAPARADQPAARSGALVRDVGHGLPHPAGHRHRALARRHRRPRLGRRRHAARPVHPLRRGGPPGAGEAADRDVDEAGPRTGPADPRRAGGAGDRGDRRAPSARSATR